MIGPSKLPYTTSPRLRNGVTSVSKSAPSFGGSVDSSGNVVPSITSPTAVTMISSDGLGGRTASPVVDCNGAGCGVGVAATSDTGDAVLVSGLDFWDACAAAEVICAEEDCCSFSVTAWSMPGMASTMK